MLRLLTRPVLSPGPAATVYLAYRGGFAFCWALMTTLSLLFQVQVARLSPVELVVVGTVLEASCFVGEIPTSVLADRVSRRASVIVGLVVLGIGFALQAVPSFGAILLAQVVWGLGYTFISSADVAWVVDEVGPDRVQPVLTRGTQLALATGFLGTLAAGGLGLFGLGVPLVCSGIGMVVLAGWLLLRMPETRKPPADPELGRGVRAAVRSTGRSLADAVRAARASRLVRGFCWIGLLAGLSSEVFDRLWTARVIDTFGLPHWFGPPSAALWFTGFALVGQLLALATSLLANRFSPAVADGHHPNRLLALLTGLQVAGVAGFALAGTLFPGLAAMWVRDAAREVAGPVQTAWLHRDLDSDRRATVGSVVGQADQLGQLVGGPPLGALATRTSIPVALLVSAVIFAPAVALFARIRPPAAPPA